MTSLIVLTALSTAQAAGGGGELLLGVGYDADDNPSALRISARGSTPVAGDESAGLAVVFPVSMTSSGDDGFGWSTQNTALEVVPSLRGALGSEGIQAYGDLGFGVAWQFSETTSWLGTASSERTRMMTQLALGMRLGGTQPGSVALVIEPVSLQQYGFDEDRVTRFSSLAGIHTRW